MMNNVSVLNVKLHEEIIGTITILPNDRSIFAFSEQYIENQQRNILSLSFKDEFGELITNQPATGPNLLPFFSNLLPEGALRDYLAERAGIKQVRELALLQILGQDLPGAITIEPFESGACSGAIKDEGKDEGEQRKENPLKFSLAGVQLKFSAYKNKGKNGGLTIPINGVGGSWIAKLPSCKFDNVPENEFSFMHIAKTIGIDVPEIDLISLDKIDNLPQVLGNLRGDKAFIIQRFDRSKNGAIHIEDFAQIFAIYPSQKYQKASYRNIANVLGIETEQKDIAEFIRRLVFSTLIGNNDMHLKNWSLIYYDKKNASLSPAYDLLSTIAYFPDETMALKYARTNKMAELNLEELSYLADKAKLPEKLVLDSAKQTVCNFIEVWAKEKNNLFLSKTIIKKIDEHIKTLAIIKEI